MRMLAHGSTLRSQVVAGLFGVICAHKWGSGRAPGSAAVEQRMPGCGAVPERCWNMWLQSGELFIPTSILAALQGNCSSAAPAPSDKENK